MRRITRGKGRLLALAAKPLAVVSLVHSLGQATRLAPAAGNPAATGRLWQAPLVKTCMGGSLLLEECHVQEP